MHPAALAVRRDEEVDVEAIVEGWCCEGGGNSSLEVEPSMCKMRKGFGGYFRFRFLVLSLMSPTAHVGALSGQESVEALLALHELARMLLGEASLIGP